MNHENQSLYVRFGFMILLSFIAMYILMYSMIDSITEFIPNLNQFYMAALMASSMVIVEMGLMFSMYPNKRLNVILIVLGIFILAGSFLLIRQQTLIGDKEFLRSMIPHHSGALLMCREANLSDQEIKDLCAEIIEGQQEEIDQMKRIQDRIEK